MRLFYSPGACSLVAHIALEETGAPFEAVRVAMSERAHHRPEYLGVNPRGLVPALEYQGRVYTESIAILTLAGQLFPASGLLPLGDLPALARVYERLAFFATSVHGGFARLFRVARPDEYPTPDAATQALDRSILRAHFIEIDAMLAEGPWLLGDRYSVADGYPLTFRRWARRQRFDIDEFSHWQAHSRRMLERPAVRRALATEGLDPAEFQ